MKFSWQNTVLTKWLDRNLKYVSFKQSEKHGENILI